MKLWRQRRIQLGLVFGTFGDRNGFDVFSEVGFPCWFVEAELGT
jgi:hypothetical protein